MKVTYETLPESAQKAYNQTNKIRKVSLFIAIGLSVVFLIIFGVSGETKNFMELLLCSLLAGCCIHGLIHALMIIKPLFKKFLKSLLKIYFPPLMIINGAIFAVVTWFAMCFLGIPCMIIDLVLYLKKKPLVYPSEVGSFLKLKAVQEEMQVMAMQEMRYPQEDAQTKIVKLKQMLDDGLITEDEYNQKKTELLSTI